MIEIMTAQQHMVADGNNGFVLNLEFLSFKFVSKFVLRFSDLFFGILHGCSNRKR